MSSFKFFGNSRVTALLINKYKSLSYSYGLSSRNCIQLTLNIFRSKKLLIIPYILVNEIYYFILFLITKQSMGHIVDATGCGFDSHSVNVIFNILISGNEVGQRVAYSSATQQTKAKPPKFNEKLWLLLCIMMVSVLIKNIFFAQFFVRIHMVINLESIF